MRRHLFCSLLGVALLSRAAPASPEEKRGVITLSDEGGIYSRPVAYTVPHRRVLEGARARLTQCHEIALSEDPKVNAEIDAMVRIGPNGEVTSVVLTSRAPVAEAALVCFKRRLSALAFDPPGGSGAALRVALILGEPSSVAKSPLPLKVEAVQLPFMAGLITMRLAGTPPAPAFRAVRSAIRALEACAAATAPPSEIVVDARMLVSETGDVDRLFVTGTDHAESLVRCANDARWPATRGPLSHVDVRLAIAKDGKVSVAP